MSQSQDTNKQASKNSGSTAAAKLPPFDTSLMMAMSQARDAIIAQFVPLIREHDLTTQQWRAIRILDQEGGLEITELAQRCHILKPSMSRIAQNLKDRGIVERKKVAADNRRSNLFITEKGREIVRLIAPDSLERYKFMEQRFGNTKLKQLKSLLFELADAIQEDTPEEQ